MRRKRRASRAWLVTALLASLAGSCGGDSSPTPSNSSNGGAREELAARNSASSDLLRLVREAGYEGALADRIDTRLERQRLAGTLADKIVGEAFAFELAWADVEQDGTSYFASGAVDDLFDGPIVRIRIPEAAAQAFASANSSSRKILTAARVTGVRPDAETGIKINGVALELVVNSGSHDLLRWRKETRDGAEERSVIAPSSEESKKSRRDAISSTTTLFAFEPQREGSYLGVARVEFISTPSKDGRTAAETIRISYAAVGRSEPTFGALTSKLDDQLRHNNKLPETTGEDGKRIAQLRSRFGELAPLALFVAEQASTPLTRDTASALRTKWVTAMDVSASELLNVLKTPAKSPRIASETRVQGATWRNASDGLRVTLHHPGTEPLELETGGFLIASLLPTLVRIWQAGELN